VWAHGLGRNREIDHQVGLLDLGALPLTIVRYDARGHGMSDDPPDGSYAWDELARDQLALADCLGIERFVSAGASMGCGTALHLGVLAPERLRGLVLVIPPTGWETRAAQAQQWAAAGDMVERGGIDAYADQSEQRPVPGPFRATESAYRRRSRASLQSLDPARLARELRGAAQTDFPPRDAVASIRLPALILAWTGDPVHPESSAEELVRLMPRAELDLAATEADVARWPDLVRTFVGSLDD
jgi:pimeloyl-ACP methyl ester carboxylesterase